MIWLDLRKRRCKSRLRQAACAECHDRPDLVLTYCSEISGPDIRMSSTAATTIAMAANLQHDMFDTSAESANRYIFIASANTHESYIYSRALWGVRAECLHTVFLF